MIDYSLVLQDLISRCDQISAAIDALTPFVSKDPNAFLLHSLMLRHHAVENYAASE